MTKNGLPVSSWCPGLVLFSSCFCLSDADVSLVSKVVLPFCHFPSCGWSMGTTASAAPPPPPPPLEGVQGVRDNGMADSRPSLSMSPFHTVNVHNNKAKSIITNKVAPVVIT